METQTIINLGIGLVCTGAGFIIRALWDAVTAMRKDLGDLQHNIAQDYARRDEFRDVVNRVMERLDSIYEKLDSKADRP